MSWLQTTMRWCKGSYCVQNCQSWLSD